MTAVSSDTEAIRLKIMFPTLLGEAAYPDYGTIKDRLVARIDQLSREDSEGIEISRQRYPHGYTSFYTQNALHRDPVFAELTQFLQQQAERYASGQSWDMQRFVPVMSSMWCSINRRNSSHGQHLHPFSHISGVFYVSCQSDSGSIYFKDPRQGRWMVPPPLAQNLPENTLNIRIDPLEGNLLLFPSFLEHGVEQNNTDSNRYSISFNFEIQPRRP